MRTTIQKVKRRRVRDARLAWLALLGSHHVDIARYEGHLRAPAFGAVQFQRFMLGDGLGALKLLPALLATILVGRHKLKSSNDRGTKRMYNLPPIVTVEKPILMLSRARP